MKAIFSDFDGTFYDKDYDKNIELIKSLDVDFIVATGRHINSLSKDLKAKCRYYICNDGAYVLDENKNFIYKNSMNNNSVLSILEKIKELKIDDYFFDSYTKQSKELTFPINKISVKIKDRKNINYILNYLLDGIDDCYGYLSQNYINILDNNSTKTKGIDFVTSLNKYDEVYVIGNDINDYDMINKYNGYLVSDKQVKNFNCIKSFSSIKDIIKK